MMVAAGSRGAITGERDILRRLPLARGRHYQHLYYIQRGVWCVRADPATAAATTARCDAISGEPEP